MINRRTALSAVPKLARLLALPPLLVATTAYAFNEGGHHYTVLGVYYEGRQNASVPDQGKMIESFCSQIPDLAQELDAITQRERVLKDRGDWRWGLLSQCGTATSRHMVATHFYLHALTGTSTLPVRQAAIDIIRDIDATLKGTNVLQDRVNLLCQRGFASHLLGDTFAHSILEQRDGEDQLYPTGLGHWQDWRTPDYMLSREILGYRRNHWQEWVQTAAEVLDGRKGGGTAVQALAGRVPPSAKTAGNKFAESPMREELKQWTPPAWAPYNPPIWEWNKSSILDTPCQSQVAKAPALADGRGGLLRPDCKTVWEDYLRRAVGRFPVKPKRSCAAVDPQGRLVDRLEDGR